MPTARRAVRRSLFVECLEDRIALSTWTPIGPAPIIGDAADAPGMGYVSGRVTSIVTDPNDASGNTVYIGSAGGGVWAGTHIISGPATRP